MMDVECLMCAFVRHESQMEYEIRGGVESE